MATRKSAVLMRAKGVSKTKAYLLGLLASQQSSREPRVFQKPRHLLWLLVSQQSSRDSRGFQKGRLNHLWIYTHKSARAKEFSKVKASTSKSTVKETKDASETNVAIRKLAVKN